MGGKRNGDLLLLLLMREEKKKGEKGNLPMYLIGKRNPSPSKGRV